MSIPSLGGNAKTAPSGGGQAAVDSSIINEVFCLSDQRRRARYLALRRSHILVIGQGALGGKITLSLARQGIGKLTACDPDLVEAPNIPLQEFDMAQLHQPKALAIKQTLGRTGLHWTKAEFYPLPFKNIKDQIGNVSVAVCVVDNDITRLEVSRWSRARGIPTVIAGISADGWCFYVYGQKPGQGCLACAIPDVLDPGAGSCTRHANPAVMPVVAGYVIQWALGCLVGELKPQWDRVVCNTRSGWMAASSVKPNPGCPECRRVM